MEFTKGIVLTVHEDTNTAESIIKESESAIFVTLKRRIDTWQKRQVIEIITRFRIEATGSSQEEVQQELLKAVGDIAKAIRAGNNTNGHWECTDDVIHLEKPVSYPQREPDKAIYKGRIVMTYRGFSDEQE